MTELNGVTPEELSQAESFVKANLTELGIGRKCVDGRYEKGQNSLARPGGDMGYVFALLALSHERGLGLEAKGAFEIVYSWLSEEGKFYFHTDDSEHAQGEGEIGCGYIAKAKNTDVAGKYGIKEEEVSELIEYAKKRAQDDEKVEMVTLKGGHKELGVLVVNSEDTTVNSQNEEGSLMYFIYDKKKDYEMLEEMAEKLSLPQVTSEDLKRVSDRQTNAIIHELAKNRPIFEVKTRDGKVGMLPLGRVS